MNENLQKIIGTVTRFFQNLTPSQRVSFGTAAVFLSLLGVGATIWWNQDPFQVLFSDLEVEDSRAVTQKLGEEKIAYQASHDGAVVSVRRSKVDMARMVLAKAGLPGQDVVGLEKFDGGTLGMSSYVQRIHYIRGVQGELTRSIQQLAAVKRSRVHISIPPKRTFMEDEEAPKASVILELKKGRELTKQEIRGVAHLVASAVEGLKVSQVTIVDTDGNFLHRPEDESAQGLMSSALIEMQRNLEQQYERQVLDILSPIVGMGKAKAKVAAEMDAARVNTTEESFDPDRAVVRSKVQNDEVTTGNKPNPMGIPGSRSNLPGAEAAAPPPVPMANTRSEKTVQNTNYSIPRKIQVTDKPSGSLKRLTVAVIVDGTYTQVNGADQFVPRTEQEMQRIRELVANAVGFDETRRDSITVTSLPFHAADLGPDEVAPEIPWYREPSLLWTGVAVLGIFASLGAFLFLLRKGNSPSAPLETEIARQLVEGPKTVAQLEAASSQDGRPEIPGTERKDLEPIEKQEEAELRKKILERLLASPKKGSVILEEWIHDDQARLTETEALAG